MWTGTDDKLCCPDQIESAMCIGKDVKGNFLQHIWDKVYISTDLKGCWHDQI
jgi:hypothetical protein